MDQLTTVAEKPLTKPGCRPHPRKDEFGRAHLVICCDFKQLPPATSRPPFIAANPGIMEKFRFRVLRQNRRIATSSDPEKQRDLENFHTTLESIAAGQASSDVRKFLVGAYVRGALRNQDNVGFEESIACFTKRRYRDGWNRAVLGRSAQEHERS